MTLTRRTDWQARLDAVVVQRLRMPFAWGANDCATFAADAVLAMTDVDLLEGPRGQWTSARQAFRILQPLGGLAGAVRAHGLQEVGPRLARRGDLVLLRAPGRERSMRGAMGICLGERIAAPGMRGLVMASLGEGVTAWRV
jgi:hypothetical protein